MNVLEMGSGGKLLFVVNNIGRNSSVKAQSVLLFHQQDFRVSTELTEDKQKILGSCSAVLQ